MNRLVAIAVIGITLMTVAPLRAAQLVDGIAAIVGSDIILYSEIRAREEARRDIFRSKEKLTRNEILDELIEERLLSQELNRLEIEASDQEMDHAIRVVLAQNQMSLDQLKRELRGKGIAWDAYRKDLAERIKIMKFMRQRIHSKVDVTDADYEMYRRRYPQKAKQQSKEEIEQDILETKSRQYLKSYPQVSSI